MFNEIELFAVLVYTFHKEPIEIADFDPSYLEHYFDFSNVVKTTGRLVKNLQNKVNLSKKCFNPPYP